MSSLLKTRSLYKDILSAQQVLKGIVHRTSLDRSTTFSRLVGSETFLKLENLQKTGSFKVRGAYFKLSALSEKERRGVIAASAGNHAQGVAYAASLLNIPSTVVMPLQASPSKVSATRQYGSKIVLHGNIFDDALAKAKDIAGASGLTFISAFDDAKVISGQGTVGLEIMEDLPRAESIYIPVGGGGLIAGIAVAVKSRNPSVKLIGVQSKSFPAMSDSFRSGVLTESVKGATVADGIAIKRPGSFAFEIVKNLVDDVVLVGDKEIAETMFLLMERSKLVVEPAGAAALAYLYANGSNTSGGTVAVLSGGNVDMYLLGQIVAKGLLGEGRLIKLSFNIMDKPGAMKPVVDKISETRANIVEITHDRTGAAVQAGHVKVTFSLETEDKSHTRRVVKTLKKNGLKFTACD